MIWESESEKLSLIFASLLKLTKYFPFARLFALSVEGQNFNIWCEERFFLWNLRLNLHKLQEDRRRKCLRAFIGKALGNVSRFFIIRDVKSLPRSTRSLFGLTGYKSGGKCCAANTFWFLNACAINHYRINKQTPKVNAWLQDVAPLRDGEGGSNGRVGLKTFPSKLINMQILFQTTFFL